MSSSHAPSTPSWLTDIASSVTRGNRAAIAGPNISATSGEGSARPLSSNRSWLNPKTRLSRTCSAWWARSNEKPPSRMIASSDST